MAAVTNVRWDNLGGSLEGCLPIYSVDRNKTFFYLMYDGMGSYVAELLEGLGFEEVQNPGPYRIPWSGPYTHEKASDVIRWFLTLVGAQVGDTSKYEAIVAYQSVIDGDLRGVKLAACVSLLHREGFYPMALPHWFKGRWLVQGVSE